MLPPRRVARLAAEGRLPDLAGAGAAGRRWRVVAQLDGTTGDGVVISFVNGASARMSAVELARWLRDHPLRSGRPVDLQLLTPDVAGDVPDRHAAETVAILQWPAGDGAAAAAQRPGPASAGRPEPTRLIQSVVNRSIVIHFVLRRRL